MKNDFPFLIIYLVLSIIEYFILGIFLMNEDFIVLGLFFLFLFPPFWFVQSFILWGISELINIIMAQTKKQEEEIKQAMLQQPPKNYGKDNYPFTIQGCPGYEGYTPENLTHEVCKYCGNISYYH